MSWYGTHAEMTRNEAVRLLPPATCRRCVYYYRAVTHDNPTATVWSDGKKSFTRCRRCGVDWAELPVARQGH